jgi:alkanesulfonate monooxygenase SsuD/methylene tetrahydromethanopterin reductase-like flavin-dependent oxidoreductase (luciferase family)
MRYGISLPNVGDWGNPHLLVELAREAEAVGWDAVFVWDCVHLESDQRKRLPTADPWIVLAAIAGATTRIKLGPIVTPPARRRPWKLARETVTLDHLSHGRLILPIGYGAIDDGAFSKVGEPTDARTRAARVDEALQILTGLWSGEPFAFQGEQYYVEEMTFLPRPVQSPRIPIWLDALWPSRRSMRRAIRYDGILPGVRKADGGPTTPEDIRTIREWIEEERVGMAPIDIVHEGETPGDNVDVAAAIIQPWTEAGVTWWIESVWTHFYRGTVETMRKRIAQGPPKRP